MLTMDDINDIITLYKIEGLSLREIARRTGYNFRTVRKYADKADWNDAPLKRKEVDSRLDPLKPVIDQWLEGDLNAPRKQRHTGKRVYDRLVTEHSNELYVGLRTVQAYVSGKKRIIYKNIKDCAIYLDHPATEAQVDFGEFAYYDKDGRQRNGYGLVMSFPRSNGGYIQAFRGENQECLLEGMKKILNHIGKIPSRIVFDNLSAAVSSIGRSGERGLVDQFKKFCLHYGYEPVFCNPEQPNEKGNVEVKVGYGRRNYLVPVPTITDFEIFNQQLLEMCDSDMAKTKHYLRDKMIAELLKSDLMEMKPLPEKEFEVGRVMMLKTDGYSFVKVDKNRYSTTPTLVNREVTVRVDAETVTVLDDNYRTLIVHQREYGKQPSPIVNWGPYVETIIRKPRALKYTGFFNSLPIEWQEYFHNASEFESKKTLKAFREMFEAGTISDATDALKEVGRNGTPTADNIATMFRRLTQTESMPYNRVPSAFPILQEYTTDFELYNNLLGGAANA